MKKLAVLSAAALVGLGAVASTTAEAGPRGGAVAAGAELTSPLRWVSGPVYPRSRCFSPSGATLAVGKEVLHGAVAAHICGEQGAAVTFEQPVLKPDPVLPGDG